jgi:predicted GH43/DUF377 family glycosyl hydrolase
MRRIEIPGHLGAFNPSIVRYRNRLLMSFKIIPDPKNSFHSRIGLIWLDDEFNPMGEAQLLDTRENLPSIPSRSEDARLIAIEDRLYMVYSDCTEPEVSKGGFRVYLAELDFDGRAFRVLHPECLCDFEGETRKRREKNWVPFEFDGKLLLAYSLAPHLIFRPLVGQGACETVCRSETASLWNWGEPRGGTPALMDDGEYLAFFHSSIEISSTYSAGEPILHYFMGAYTFSAEPPFQITRISPEPIVGEDFYRGPVYKPYWKPVRVVFPGGLLIDGPYVYVVYGRQDHEAWVAKLDKKKLLQSLAPLH